MKFTTAIISCLIVIFLVSCSRGQEESLTEGEAGVDTSHFETYTYITERVMLQDVSGTIQRIWTQGGRIYFCYRDIYQSDGGIFVISQTVDGQDVRQTMLLRDTHFMIHGFSVSKDNTYEMLLSGQQASSASNEPSLIFCRFDYDGNELAWIDITSILPQALNIHDLLQVVFTGEEKIFITTNDARGIMLFFINMEDGTVGELRLGISNYNNNALAVLRDGGITALDVEQGGAVLREIDFVSRNFNETHPIIGDSASHIFSAGNNTPYDVLVSNRDYLYGYNTETNTQTILLSWMEAGIDRSLILYTGLADDGRILVITQTGILTERETQLYVLTPVLRDEIPEQITITLGGLGITDTTLSAVTKYNRENRKYQIEVIDYAQAAGGDYQAGLTRLLLELTTGAGPDILFSSFDTSIAARAPLHDLYTFIDADPELSRSDFFLNILQGLERADGSLPMLTSSFSIQTMIGTVQTVGHIDNWTLPAFFALGEENSHVEYPFGDNRSKKQFLSYMLMYTQGEYIDTESFRANFDSESFIKLLDTTVFFREPFSNERPNRYDKFLKMQRGEQIIAFEHVGDISYHHAISQAMDDNIFAIGFPTTAGGQHIAVPYDLFGINAATLHADVAWSFLRTLLLGSADVEMGFPLRVDLFNTQVDDAMTPAYAKDFDTGEYIYDDDGDLMYVPHYYLVVPGNEYIGIYEMTEVAERELRRIINSARVRHFSSTIELSHIIDEELDAFLSGVRSAEATARSLQSRVQRYLSEQELVS